MSCAGSIISTFTSDAETEERTLLQRCLYLRDYLKLGAYKSKRDKAVSGPHVKISSKALRECYVLPADGKYIESVFERLAQLMIFLKSQRTKPPRTDFTCLSRLERNKVFVDVDCIICKRGEPAGERRHFSLTKSLNILMSTVGDIFSETITEGVYMTTGGSTCGYHLFFNTLTYSDEGVTGSTLMDALDDAFKKGKLNGVAIDRGCTQMPLPTACHSNSLRYPVPYALKFNAGWKKERLNWVDMDSDVLKGFSSIAFPNRYKNMIFSLKAPSSSLSKVVEIEEKREVYPSTVKKRKQSESKDENNDEVMKTDPPVTKKICLSEVVTSKIKPFNYTKPFIKDSSVTATKSETGEDIVIPSLQAFCTYETCEAQVSRDTAPEQEPEDDHDLVSLFSAKTQATDVRSFICPTTVASSSDTTVAPKGKPTLEGSGGRVSRNTDPEREDDTDSSFSAYTKFTDLQSFVCPNTVASKSECPDLPKRKREYRRMRNMTDYEEGATATGAGKTNVLNSVPYECEKDKNSSFADKQYKAAILCAEEAEAVASKSRLEFGQRVHVVPGSSLNEPREYKLLVQLVNVNRSVYGGDSVARREWTRLQVSYFDQHLHNPVLLEILKFLFSDKCVVELFSGSEIQEIKQSTIHVLAPFKKRTEEETALLSATSDLSGNDERIEREARPHKLRIIGALIRMCTHLFGMVTAVLSDLRKVQQTMERRDMSLLNRTVVEERNKGIPNYRDAAASRQPNDSDDELDCSASMSGGGCFATDDTNNSRKRSTNYVLLTSLIVHEQANLSDQALYALLYYYHHFPSITIDRILDEVHHDGLMVTAAIKYFLMYDHRDKLLTLQEVFEGFNDATIALSGPERFVEMRKKNRRRGNPPKNNNRSKKNNNPNSRRLSFHDDNENSSEAGGSGEAVGNAEDVEVTAEEVEKLLGGAERKRRRMMCDSYSANAGLGPTAARPCYEWKDKHLWQAVINYYLRPVVMHEDRMVFANDGYDTFEDDAVESCVAHVITKCKITKADIVTTFKDARTIWRMHHGSQLIYESDLKSDKIGCCFHINIALKMYEMFCGGCVTRMKRMHKNYLIDRSRFNMSVYDVVAECRTATINLTSAIDRSYMNLLLRQPVVPPFLEDPESRQYFMSEAEIQRGSFCCLNVMDYIRAMNLFERSNCHSRTELDTCEFVEKFLDDLYTNEISADSPPDMGANNKMHLLYTFYSLYLYEVVFVMRHAYAKRENCYISIERLCYELDVRELLVLFFGESSMKRVEGLNKELDYRIRRTVEEWDVVHSDNYKNSNLDAENEELSSANSRFDIRPVLAVEIPDKILRMKTLFGQFGFEVMQDGGGVSGASTSQFDGSGISSEMDLDWGSGDSVENRQREKIWEDESKFEQEFYESENWLETVCERIKDVSITGNTSKQAPSISTGSGYEGVFLRETIRSVMRLELKKHIDHDRLGRLNYAVGEKDRCNEALATLKNLPMRLKLLAFVLTTHSFKLRTNKLAPDFVEETYREVDGRFAEESRFYEGEVNCEAVRQVEKSRDSPESIWCRTTEALLRDRRSLLSHARWLAEKKFKNSFFVGLDPERMYSVLYEYMKDNEDRYPAFKRYNDNEDTKSAASNLCTAMMFILIMSAYDQEHVDLYLKVFLAVEWPGQWAKTIFVWKSNSNAGKSYLFDSIIKRACANSTCINDPKGGKENAPEKAEYVKNFVLLANEFSQANSNELKKIVSESTFKFRMNYGNVMNEAYATGKIMFNCNTLPPTSDEAAINRLTLFNVPFWFSRRQNISDAMLNWICGLGSTTRTRWEMAYRYELPSLLTEVEKAFFESHVETKNETDLFNGYTAVRPSLFSKEFNKATSSLFLVQNKTSLLYASCSPPTESIVHGLVNITNHFSWLRFFKRIDTPVDFSTLPASSEAVRSEWLSMTLPYQEWKHHTGAKADPSGRVKAETINRSLQAFSVKKNINYFGIRQFFETDFASSREAIKNEYYIRFNSKVFCD